MQRPSDPINAARETSGAAYQPPHLEKLGKVSQDTKGAIDILGTDILNNSIVS
jgi:hypothetical protein